MYISGAGTSSIGWEFEKFKRSFLPSIVEKDFESQYLGPPKDASVQSSAFRPLNIPIAENVLILPGLDFHRVFL